MMIYREDWEWYGNAAHLIVGRWCRFHLATKIGDMIVSTVGEYVHPRHSGSSERTEAEWLQKNWPGEEVGCDRKFETMVFAWDGTYCECGCGLPKIIPSELACNGYNDHHAAREGHLEMCLRAANGEFNQPESPKE